MAKGASILVVDDDPDIRDLCFHALSADGYDVRTAGNGRDAADLLLAYPADLVLMDVLMPGMDGLTATQLIHARARTWNIPVVVMSGADNLDRLAPEVVRVAAAIIAKPFDVLVLRQTVARLLSTRAIP